MREAGVTVTAHQVTLRALFDGRSDVVQTHGALQQGEEAGGVHQPQLQVGLLHQDRVHPGCWRFLELGRIKLSLCVVIVKILKWKHNKTLVLLGALMKTLSSFTSFQFKLLTKTSDVKRSFTDWK